MNFNPLTISKITKETANSVSIAFNLPEQLKADYAFIAGQYVTLKTDIRGEEVRRDYSLCTNPAHGELKVVVKEVEQGTFSHFANNELKEGDRLEVSTPNGRFLFEPQSATPRTVVAFAAGSGITPIMSICKSVLENEPQSKFVLVYGNKSPEDTIFYEALHALQAQYPERFYLKFIFSRRNEADALFGRIDNSTVNYILNQIDGSLFYLCGPEAMIKTVSDSLKQRGVSDEAIKFELFTAPAEENDSSMEAVKDGHTNITVLVLFPYISL